MSYKLLYCAIIVCGIIAIRLHYIDKRYKDYNDYLRRFNKSYSEEEYQRRILYFEESLREIELLNHGELRTGAVHGLTKFSDWHMDEFSNKMLLKDSPCYAMKSPKCPPLKHQSDTYLDIIKHFRSGVLPSSWDWRDKRGVIGPVENQKMCNGCWAFGIVGVMEAMAAIYLNAHDELSVQELIDCSDVNAKCSGGNIDTALRFLCLHKYYLTTETNYPQILVNETCKNYTSGIRRIKSYAIQCHLDEDSILNKVVYGPVLAVVKPTGWRNYVSGILTRNCFDGESKFTHVVQIVGYGNTTDEFNNEIKFFIIKNSYGTDWGEDGYIRISRDRKLNLCGVYDHIAELDVA